MIAVSGLNDFGHKEIVESFFLSYNQNIYLSCSKFIIADRADTNAFNIHVLIYF